MMSGLSADRSEALSRLCAADGWTGADLEPLAGDASARRYLRMRCGSRRAVLMDAEPERAGNVAPFLRLRAHLDRIGLSVPRLFAADAAAGFLVLEDFGDTGLAGLLDAEPAEAQGRLRLAVDLLAPLQAAPAPHGLPDLGAADWAEAAMLAVTEYARAPDAPGLRAALTEAMATYADGPRVLILRDFHAGNLMWLSRRHSLRRLGVLDFQDGQMGQPGYDLVSLLDDARRDVDGDTAGALTRHFADRQGVGMRELDASLATLGAQRALRILGIFARLARRDGKTGYLVHLPRVWGQLQRRLAHPALAALRREVEAVLPPPAARRPDLGVMA
jgi:N-acetylmuramate 1-kinase